MPKIKFQNPEAPNETFDAPVGLSILESAVDHGVPLNHDCGGNCACTTCRVWVEKGAEILSPMSEDERALLEANEKLEPHARLGCQCRMIAEGEVVVRF